MRDGAILDNDIGIVSYDDLSEDYNSQSSRAKYVKTFTDPPPEQLFLDYSVADVQSDDRSGKGGMGTVEPWATQYCDAINERRYGDAIWTRYDITSKTQTLDMTGWRTLDPLKEILEDAVDYCKHHPDLYEDALQFYLHNSESDTRPDIIAALRGIPQKLAKGSTRL